MADIQWNSAFFAAVLKLPGVVHQTEAVAQKAAAKARATAPVKTGAYKRSITVVRVQARYRIVWLVVALDPKGLLIESKTGTLGRALRSVI